MIVLSGFCVEIHHVACNLRTCKSCNARGLYSRTIIIIILFFTPARFIALMLVEPSKYLKQNTQIELNRVKNPNWPEANQLASGQGGSRTRGL